MQKRSMDDYNNNSNDISKKDKKHSVAFDIFEGKAYVEEEDHMKKQGGGGGSDLNLSKDSKDSKDSSNILNSSRGRTDSEGSSESPKPDTEIDNNNRELKHFEVNINNSIAKDTEQEFSGLIHNNYNNHKLYGPEQNSVLHVACANNDIELVARLLDGSPRMNVNIVNGMGDTPLHTAVTKGGKSDLIRMLVMRRANVNARSYGGQTPLHRACKLGDRQVVQTLIDLGASLYSKPNFKISCADDGASPLIIACEYNRADIVELLLSLDGLNVNETTRQGNNLLHLACLHNFERLAENLPEILLNHKIDPNKKNNHNETPLYLACSYRSKRIPELLLDRGANPNISISMGVFEGQTALHLASSRGHVLLVDLLLYNGANIDGFSSSFPLRKCKFSPLDLATNYVFDSIDRKKSNKVSSGHKEVIALLISRGAAVKQEMLERACSNACIDVMHMLLAAGEDEDHHNILLQIQAEEDNFVKFGEVISCLQRWPWSMAMAMLKELVIYHHLDCDSIIDLIEMIN